MKHMLRSASLCAVCYVLIDTACIVCGRVCVTSICPSIDRCSSVWRFAAVARRAGDINRQQQWRAPHSSTVFSSKCEHCHVVSCCRKLNTDLLIQDQPPSPPHNTTQVDARGRAWWVVTLTQSSGVWHRRYQTCWITIRDAILTCARKPTWVSLIYRTEPTTKKCKNRKN